MRAAALASVAAPILWDMPRSQDANVPPEWEPVPGSERPVALYHAVRLGSASADTVSRRAQGIARRGLTPHLSRHRVAERDQRALLFLFRDSLSAEIYGAGGPIYEVILPEDAPLYRDPALAGMGSMFTTVAVAPECVRRLSLAEITASPS